MRLHQQEAEVQQTGTAETPTGLEHADYKCVHFGDAQVLLY